MVQAGPGWRITDREIVIARFDKCAENSTVSPLSTTVGVLGRNWINSVTPMTRMSEIGGSQVEGRAVYYGYDQVLFPLVTPSDCGSVGTKSENEPFTEVRTLCTSVSLSSFRNLTCRAIGPVLNRLSPLHPKLFQGIEKLWPAMTLVGAESIETPLGTMTTACKFDWFPVLLVAPSSWIASTRSSATIGQVHSSGGNVRGHHGI